MDTKGMFMRSFRELVREAPIDKVSVSEICRKAGLSRQAFYAHYLDKYDLSIKVYEAEFAPIAQGHRNRETTWLESGIQHLEIYARDPKYYRNVLSSRDPSGLRAYLADRMFEEFKHKCEMRGAVFESEEMLYALNMVVATTNELTFAWVEGGCLEAPEEIVKRFDLCRPLVLAPYLEDKDSSLLVASREAADMGESKDSFTQNEKWDEAGEGEGFVPHQEGELIWIRTEGFKGDAVSSRSPKPAFRRGGR